jgi:hypothetical protein
MPQPIPQHVVDQVAFLSLLSSEWARAYYDQQRARGHAHHQALRALGVKWLKIIFVMWQRRRSLSGSLLRRVVYAAILDLLPFRRPCPTAGVNLTVVLRARAPARSSGGAGQ